MTYDLGAWHDPQRALRGCEDEHYGALAEAEQGEPDAAVAAFLAECSRRWPWVEDGDEVDDAVPWATWPLEYQAGPLGVALNLRWSATGGTVEEIVRLAHAHGLTVYDPQGGEAYESGDEAAFAQPPPPERPRRRRFPWRR